MSARMIQGPWSFWRGLAVLAAFLVVYAALSAAHMLTVKSTIGFEAYLGDGPRFPPHMLIASQAIKAAAIVAVVWLVALRLQRLDWSARGLHAHAQALACRWRSGCPDRVRDEHRRRQARCVRRAGVGALYGLALRLGDAPAWQMLILLGFTIIVTPLAEETFFRGFLLQWMATHRPLWLAILVSSIMFGVSHIVPPQAIVAASMAVLISLLYVLSRSLWPCIVCHIANNALGVAFGMAGEAGMLPAWLTPPA